MCQHGEIANEIENLQNGTLSLVLLVNFASSISGKSTHVITALCQRTLFKPTQCSHNVYLTFCVVTWMWTAPLITRHFNTNQPLCKIV